MTRDQPHTANDNRAGGNTDEDRCVDSDGAPLRRGGISIGNVAVAETIYRHRAMRADLFGASTFNDPAWDILLHLYIIRGRGRTETITQVCDAARCPPTTAMRWLGILESQGRVARQAHGQDRRKQIVALTDEGTGLMTRFVESVTGALMIN